MKLRYLVVLGCVLLLFVIGFFREFVFENINLHMTHLSQNDGMVNLPGPLILLKSFSYQQLYYTKFVLVVLFAALYFGFTFLGLSSFYGSYNYLTITLLFFGGVFTLSFVIFIIGKVTGKGAEAYSISRYLIEFIQSPLSLFILIPATKLLNEEKTKP